MLRENSRECSVDFDFDSVESEQDTAERPQFTQADLLETVRRVVSFIRSSDRSRLTVDCLYLALGDAELEGVTMTEVATKHGLTKAAISKRTRTVRERLHLPPNANNKSSRAVRQYGATNRSPLRLDALASAV